MKPPNLELKLIQYFYIIKNDWNLDFYQLFLPQNIH